MEATLTSKAQITLPKALRELLSLATGDKIEFVAMPDGSARLSRVGAGPGAGARSFGALRGIGGQPPSAAPSEADVQAAVGQMLAQDDARIRADYAPPLTPAQKPTRAGAKK